MTDPRAYHVWRRHGSQWVTVAPCSLWVTVEQDAVFARAAAENLVRVIVADGGEALALPRGVDPNDERGE